MTKVNARPWLHVDCLLDLPLSFVQSTTGVDIRRVPLLRAETLECRPPVTIKRYIPKAKRVRISDIVQGVLARILFLCHSVIGVTLVIGQSSSSLSLVTSTVEPDLTAMV